MRAALRTERARRWGGAVVSLVAVAAVVWWAVKQDSPRVPVTATDMLEVAAAVGLYAVATLMRGWRWHQILRRLGAGHRTADAYALVTVGYMGNAVLPARGGELLRVVLLARRSNAGKGEVAGSIIAERVLDAISLAVLFGTLSLAGIAGASIGPQPALTALGLLVLLGVSLWAYLQARRLGRLDTLARRIRPFVRASRSLLGRYGLVLLAVSMLVWLIEGAIFWLVARSLLLDLSIVEGVFLVVLSAVSGLIPAAPGYVGTFDAAVIFGLKAVGVGGGQAVGFALLVRFVLFVPITLAGLGFFLVRYGGLRRSRHVTEGGPADLRAKPRSASS